MKGIEFSISVPEGLELILVYRGGSGISRHDMKINPESGIQDPETDPENYRMQ